MLARKTWYSRHSSPGGVPSPRRKYPAAKTEIPAAAPPSTIRNSADSASSRRCKGSAGSPIGSTATSGERRSAISDSTNTASATTPPAGNSTRETKRKRRIAATPVSATASQSAIATSSPSITSHGAASDAAAIASAPLRCARALGHGRRRRALARPCRRSGIVDHAAGHVLDPVPREVVADQLAHDLRCGAVLQRAQVLERGLLVRVEQQRQPGGLAFHRGAPDRIAITRHVHVTRIR